MTAFDEWWVEEVGRPPLAGESKLALSAWDHQQAEIDRLRLLCDEMDSQCARIYEDKGASLPNPMLKCPRCDAPALDYDGFAVVTCPGAHHCGYCTHPSADEDAKGRMRCGLCGADVTDEG